MVNMLRTAVEKVVNMQEQMDNVSREMETIRIKGNARNKHWQMKNTFDGFISRLEMAEERIRELKEVLKETYQNVWVSQSIAQREI